MDEKVIERFWVKVAVGGPGDCWEWRAAKSGRRGYGSFRICGKDHRAHRVAYELTNGPIPAGMLVCHRCDNPPCVNPAHLWLGTNADNMADMAAKGRANNRAAVANRKGENCPRAKLTWAEVNEIRRLRGSVKQRDLARRFGVSPPAVCAIQKNITWVLTEADARAALAQHKGTDR